MRESIIITIFEKGISFVYKNECKIKVFTNSEINLKLLKYKFIFEVRVTLIWKQH